MGGRAGAALGVADDPAHRVAGGHRPRADELFAGLERNVGDLPDGGIDLIERALRPRIDLHGVDEAVANRLHPRGGIGLVDPRGRIGRLGRPATFLYRLHLAGQRQRAWQLHDLDRRRRINRLHCGRGVVIRNLGRLLRGGAAGERGC